MSYKKSKNLNAVDALIREIEKISKQKINLNEFQPLDLKEQRKKEALLAQKEIKAAYEKSRCEHIEKAHRTGRISSQWLFSTMKVDPFNATAVSVAKNFAQKVSSQSKDEQPMLLLLRGNEGTGKTVIAHAIANEFLEKGGKTVELVSFDEIKDTWIYAVNENREERVTRNENWTRYCSCDLLIIDSVSPARQALTFFEQKIFSTLLRERYDNKLSIAITTPLFFNHQNQLREALTNYIVDFFAQYKNAVVELEGPSRRKKLKIYGKDTTI